MELQGLIQSEWAFIVEANREAVRRLVRERARRNATRRAELADPNSSYWQTVCSGFVKAAKSGHTHVQFV